MYHRITLLWVWAVRVATGWLPDCAATMAFRGWLYGFFMPRKGRDFQVAADVRINGLEHLSVGDHVYLAPGVVILANLEIVLDSEVMIAHHTVITDGNHTAVEGSYRYGPRSDRPVRIGRGSWIGANATVLPGVTIGRGVAVGANAAVTRDIPDGAVAGGVPARVIATCAAAPNGCVCPAQPASETTC
jgi:acetyltransferase-like isoleucine patch superfamily enzyme